MIDPGAEARSVLRRRDARARLAIVGPALLVAILTLHRLDAAEVCDTSEGVEGVFLQEMLEHGHLLFPLESGRVPMYKPPLFHWTAIAADRLGGVERVTEWNLRLPSVLYAIAATLVTAALAESVVGRGVGWRAGLILAGSYQFIRDARAGTVNMALTFFETLALCAFLWWLAAAREVQSRSGFSTRRRWHYVLAAALGLGVLAKGPVGLALPLGAIGAFLVVERRWSEAAELVSLRPALLAFAVASCWYLANLVAGHWDVLLKQLGNENVGRFFGTLGSMPPTYYLENLLLASAPFSLLTPFAVVAALRLPRLGAREPGATNRTAPLAAGALRLFAIFWIVTVVFFSLAAYKRRIYLLPLCPAAAVLLAWWLDRIAKRARSPWWTRAAALVWLGTVGVNLLYIPHREVVDCGPDSVRSAAQAVAEVVPPGAALSVDADAVDVAPLLFYLERDTLAVNQLQEAAPGYAIVAENRWAAERAEGAGWDRVLTVQYDRLKFVLGHR